MNLFELRLLGNFPKDKQVGDGYWKVRNKFDKELEDFYEKHSAYGEWYFTREESPLFFCRGVEKYIPEHYKEDRKLAKTDAKMATDPMVRADTFGRMLIGAAAPDSATAEGLACLVTKEEFLRKDRIIANGDVLAEFFEDYCQRLYGFSFLYVLLALVRTLSPAPKDLIPRKQQEEVFRMFAGNYEDMLDEK